MRLIRIITSLLFCFLFLQSSGQNDVIRISSGVPLDLTTCGLSEGFNVTVNNPSPFNLSQIEIVVDMPNGIIYEAGSAVNATEVDITDLSRPVFGLTDIPSLNINGFAFKAYANCDIIAFQAAGNVIRNNITVNYATDNGPGWSSATTTNPYLINKPNLSITNFTNSSYSGSIGDTFTRCITITNGGIGELRKFTLTDDHGFGLNITNVDVGTRTTAGNIETIILDSADFVNIGDGDHLFESGEAITVCETVEITNCESVRSSIVAGWGCDGNTCQFSETGANIVFPNLIPNLVVTANESQQTCYGLTYANEQQIKIVNTGLGLATNISLDVFAKANNFIFHKSIRTHMDTSTLKIQYNNLPAQSFSPTSIENGTGFDCLPNNPVGRMYLDIDSLAAGDSLLITWDIFNCCDSIEQTNIKNHNGWGVDGSYQNICKAKYSIPKIEGRPYSYLRLVTDNNRSTGTIVDGDTGKINFMIGRWQRRFVYNKSTVQYRFEYTLPPCLKYAGNFHVLHHNDVARWDPDSVIIQGNKVIGLYKKDIIFEMNQAQVIMDVIGDCSNTGCGGTGEYNVYFDPFFVPDSTCDCTMRLSETRSATVKVLCPETCEGINMKDFWIKRTNYGLPDNDEDGLPDASGSLDFTKIRTDRAMFGDTITASYNGVIKTSVANPSWDYAYVDASITWGNYLNFLDAELIIHQSSTGNTYTCTGFTPTVSTAGNQRDWNFEIDVNNLIASGCVPAGFKFNDNDSLIFQPRFKIVYNHASSTDIREAFTTTKFYTSNVQNPDSADQFSCNKFEDFFLIIGYYYTSQIDESYTIQSCDTLELHQYYYMSIGPCCTNYFGGNLFKKEYRNWGYADTLRVRVPEGYVFVSGVLAERRTVGTFNSTESPEFPISPLDPRDDTLIFPVEQLYDGFGGAIPLSDEGFRGYMRIKLVPTCGVQSESNRNIGYDWFYGQPPALQGTNYTDVVVRNNDDYVTYKGPDLFVQSTLPTVLAPDKETSWEVSISNASPQAANNTWIATPKISGVTVTEIYDIDNSTALTANANGIYELGVLPGSATRKFRVKANFVSCDVDSVIFYTGWNCYDGYPTSVSSYPCTPDSIVLKLIPLVATMSTQVNDPTGYIDLCDSAVYIVEGINVQLGTAYDMKLDVQIPAGVTIVPGSSRISYPDSTSFVAAPDPVFVNGRYQWDISAIEDSIGINGLKGILDTTKNKVYIKFEVFTNCDYIQGSIFKFKYSGESACGTIAEDEISVGSRLATAAEAPYNTEIDLRTTFISPCSDPTPMTVAIHVNGGAFDVANSDSIKIQLPPGVDYVPGSFTGIHNQPVNNTPFIDSVNGVKELNWYLPQGVIRGDSIVFSFEFQGDKDSLSCEITEFSAHTLSTKHVVCALNATTCGIQVFTGDTVLPIFTFKSYLDIVSATATSLPDPPTGETVNVSVDIRNNGEKINAGNRTILEYFHDADNSGVYSTGDILVHSDTITAQLDKFANYIHNSTFNIPAGQSCALIVRLDTTNFNECSCEPDEIAVDVDHNNAGRDTSICSGDSVQLGYGAIAGYTYSWSPDTGLSDTTASNPVFTMTAAVADTFEFILTTNRIACITSDTVQVIVNPLPIAVAGNNDTICKGDSINLSASGGGSYLWSNPEMLTDPTSPTPKTSPPGTREFVVTVTDSNGCVSQDSLTIFVNPRPVLSLSKVDPACATDSTGMAIAEANGGIQPYSFTWSTTPPQTNDTAFGLLPGSYTVNLIDSNGCDTSGTITLTEVPLPAVNAGPDRSICPGDTAQLNASGVISYSWSPANVLTSANAADPKAFPPATTVYIVTGTDIKGCETTDSVTVEVFPEPTAGVDNDTTLCYGERLTLTGTGGPQYEWQPGGETTASITVEALTNTTYVLTVTNNDGCFDTDTVTVNVFPSIPVADFTHNASFVLSQYVFQFMDKSKENITDWNWEFGDENGSTSQNPKHTYDLPGEYDVSLIVVTQDGCADTISKKVKIPECLKVPNVFTPNGDGHNDNFVIRSCGEYEFELTIYNRWGTRLFQSEAPEILWDGRTVSGEYVPDGTYYYIIKMISNSDFDETGPVMFLRGSVNVSK